jgi:outer membrane receptor protein involved in Fe transport
MFNLLRIILCTFAILLADTSQGYCQSNDHEFKEVKDLSVDELAGIKVKTITGLSRFKEATSKAPSSITIISRNEIRRLGFNTIAEILDSLRSFYVSKDRIYNNIGIRGFGRPGDYNVRVLLLIDGHRVNDNIYDSAALGTNSVVDVDMIERIEVIRGPRSAVYGNNALFGVINVITRPKENIGAGELSSSIASYDSYKSRATTSFNFLKNGSAVLSATGYKSHGQDLFYSEFNNPVENFGFSENSDREKYHNLFFNAKYENLQIEFAQTHRRKNIPTAPYDTIFNDPDTLYIDQRRFLDISFEQEIFTDSTINIRTTYDWVNFDGEYAYLYPTALGNKSKVVNIDKTRGEEAGIEAAVINRTFRNNTFIVGTSLSRDIRAVQSNYDRAPYYSYLDDHRSGNSAALFTQDTFYVLPELSFNFGLRFDHFSYTDHATSPSASLVWSMNEDTTTKIMYGRAFRAPNYFEKYYSFSPNINSNLNSEHLDTYEISIERILDDNLTLSLSNYYYRLFELIEESYDQNIDSSIYLNSGQTDAYGSEVELAGAINENISTRMSYAYQITNNEFEQTLSNSPKHLGRLSIISKLPFLSDKLYLGYLLQANSSSQTPRLKTAEGFLTSNVILTAEDVFKGIDARLSANNISNKTYSHPVSSVNRQDSIEQDGRNYQLQIVMRLGDVF